MIQDGADSRWRLCVSPSARRRVRLPVVRIEALAAETLGDVHDAPRASGRAGAGAALPLPHRPRVLLRRRRGAMRVGVCHQFRQPAPARRAELFAGVMDGVEYRPAARSFPPLLPLLGVLEPWSSQIPPDLRNSEPSRSESKSRQRRSDGPSAPYPAPQAPEAQKTIHAARPRAQRTARAVGDVPVCQHSPLRRPGACAILPFITPHRALVMPACRLPPNL